MTDRMTGYVNTPIGRGEVQSYYKGAYLVLYRQSEHTREEWAKISQHGGQTVYRFWKPEEVTQWTK